MSRKYPKTTGYWVYVHRTPDNMYYPGHSGGEDGKKQVCQRWQPLHYRTTSLHPYIEQYGWDNIEHLVIKDGLTKEQAAYWEERLIQMYTEMGCCINCQHSGNCTADTKKYYQQRNQQPERKAYMQEYMREYNQQYRQRPEVKEYYRQRSQQPERKAYMREYEQQPEWKVYNRVKNYNRYHTPIETPMEAKNKYLEYGYIPSYIKNDDLK